MDIAAAQDLARRLMSQHGLSGWTFGFDRAAVRFGACFYRRKHISLSWRLTMLNDEGEVRDTILHEIAHALTPGDGHGRLWQAACTRVGAKPLRCYTREQVVSPSRPAAWFEIGCQGCNWWVDRRRTSSKLLLCRNCGNPVAYREKSTGRVVQTSSTARVKAAKRAG